MDLVMAADRRENIRDRGMPEFVGFPAEAAQRNPS